jgi:hypothetical protein
LDVDHAVKLTECFPNCSGLLKQLTHQDAQRAVAKAFDLLYSPPGSQANVTPECCLVVFFIQQVLVRLFVKKLTNLMTTEAMILHRNKIPPSYQENYLRYQAHFSLKEVIIKYHTALEAGF